VLVASIDMKLVTFATLRTGRDLQHGRLWTMHLWWILSGSIPATSAEGAAAERVGGLCHTRRA
jgi:hypothetical protein